MNFKQGIVLTTLLLFLVAFLVYPMVITATQFTGQEEKHLSAYKDDYNDISVYKNELEDMTLEDDDEPSYDVGSLISSPNVLLNMVEAKETAYIVSGVERRYESSEIDALLQFIMQGGNVVICDDKGYANDLASKFAITFYTGKLIDDEQFDRDVNNINFTYTSAKLGTDNFIGPVWKGVPGQDGVWDQDEDGDGYIDEDPIDRADNDEDNKILSNNGLDDDHDGIVDEPREGFDEDPKDDDRDGKKDEEDYDGIDNDGDGLVDEDTKGFKLVMNNPTGVLPSNKEKWRDELSGVKVEMIPKVIARGSKASFVDMNEDGEITIPQPGEDVNQLADAKGPIDLILEVSVQKIDMDSDEPTGPIGTIIFISDAEIFTNNMVNMPVLDDEGNPIMEGGEEKRKYDNLAFAKALVVHLLPEGGKVVFDESRHSQDALLTPLAGTLWSLSVITTNPWYSGGMILAISLLGILAYVVTRGKESWIHIFDVDIPSVRETIPHSTELKRIRLKHLLLEKVRIRRGMSPDEFSTLSQGEIYQMIPNPRLAELLKRDDKTYTDEELLQLTNLVKQLKVK